MYKVTTEGQFVQRALDAQQIGNLRLEVGEQLSDVGARIRNAEFFQLFFYSALAALYICSNLGYLPSKTVGIITLSALPFQMIAACQTMVMYGKMSKVGLSIGALLTLAAIGVLALHGKAETYVSSWTICAGAVVIHIIRLVSEREDYLRKLGEGKLNNSAEPKEVRPTGQIQRRVLDARKIGYVDEKANIDEIVRGIERAEFIQFLFYGALAALYISSYVGDIPSIGRIPLQAVGIVTVVLVPFQAHAHYKTMVLYGKTSRACLTVASALSILAMGIFAIMGNMNSYSSAWTICVGGFLFHIIRLVSERDDHLRKLEPTPALETA